MTKPYDLLVKFPGLTLIHQKIPQRELGLHKHFQHEFFLPLQGEIRLFYQIKSQKKELIIGPGKMLYIPPNLDHSFNSSNSGTGERVIGLIDDKTWKLQVNKYYEPCALASNSFIKELVFYLLMHKKTKGADFFTSALIESIETLLEANLTDQILVFTEHLTGRINDSRISKALEVIDANYASLSLPEVARLSGLSTRNFNRLFLKECGILPSEYLQIKRVLKAKQLLIDTQMTISEISLEVGYNSLSKFISLFKRKTGLLPSSFRLQQIRE